MTPSISLAEDEEEGEDPVWMISLLDLCLNREVTVFFRIFLK